MPSFRLKKDTMERIEKVFNRFENARKKLHENILNYVADYRQFKGNRKDRKYFLEKEYETLAPDLNSLIFDENKFLWHVDDIVILTGLNQSSISRIIKKMKLSEGWCSKILAIETQVKSANNIPIFAYDEEIFDLIIDYQELRCLEERFINPRRGTPQDKKEIMKYWEYLKTPSEIKNELTPVEVPDIPPMKFNDVLMLMFRKAFTTKILTLSTIIFAISFELARRFNILIYIFAVISLLIFAACSFSLRFRKGRANFVSDVGAVAMLSLFFWGLGTISDGMIFTPSGTALSLESKDHNIQLIPKLQKDQKIAFVITSDFYDDIKEIYYRTNPKDNFKLTGFNDFNYPLLFIEPKEQHGKLNIELKYKDSKNKEHGIFKFSFDIDEERFELRDKKKKNERVNLPPKLTAKSL